MSEQPWSRGIAPFLVTAVVAGVTLALGWGHTADLEAWSGERPVLWLALAALCFGLGALLVVRTYAQLRNPRLFALAFLLIPVGLVHFFHHANPTPIASSTGTLTVVGDGAPPATDAPATRPRSFVGLPDGLAKSYPDLPGTLQRVFALLYVLSFALLPLLVIAATFLSFRLTARKLRMASLLLVLGEVALGALLLLLGPDDVDGLPRVPVAIGALYVGAVALALVLWRSAAGIGGAVAGLLVFASPVALGHAGLDPTDLGLDLKRVPAGAAFLQALLLPAVFLAVVAREWIVNMKHATHTDALTQIFNKAYAESIVNQEGALDLGGMYSVALMDIDHFKKVNDTHGHGAGDVVLREVCRVIKETTANRGLVCRTGGEEITVFFPGLAVDAAQRVCEEVREAVQAMEIKTTDKDGRRVKLKVTLSLGVATNRDLESGNQLHDRVRKVVEAADRAVYAAKSSGRNRVIVD